MLAAFAIYCTSQKGRPSTPFPPNAFHINTYDKQRVPFCQFRLFLMTIIRSYICTTSHAGQPVDLRLIPTRPSLMLRLCVACALYALLRCWVILAKPSTPLPPSAMIQPASPSSGSIGSLSKCIAQMAAMRDNAE